MNLLSGVVRELGENLNRELYHMRVKPLYALGFLTYRCTNCCRTCNIWKAGSDGDDELTRDQWMKVMSGLKTLGIRSLEIFGGDALLRKDVIYDIIRFCKNNGIATHFPTNANLCDRDTVASLIEAGLDMVYISVDDIEEAHDDVRGVEGNFLKVKQAIETFVELRGAGASPGLGIVCTLSGMNFRNFPRLVEFLEQYPLDAIYPRPLGEFSAEKIAASSLDGIRPEPFFVSTDGESHLLKPVELAEFKEMIRTVRKRENKVYVCWMTYYSTTDATYLKGEYPLKKCRMATTLMTINPNGDVVPCPFFRDYVIGNLVDQNPHDIWRNDKHRRFIQAQQEGRLPICRNCNIRPYHHSSLPDIINYYSVRALEKSGLYCKFQEKR